MSHLDVHRMFREVSELGSACSALHLMTGRVAPLWKQASLLHRSKFLPAHVPAEPALFLAFVVPPQYQEWAEGAGAVFRLGYDGRRLQTSAREADDFLQWAATADNRSVGVYLVLHVPGKPLYKKLFHGGGVYSGMLCRWCEGNLPSPLSNQNVYLGVGWRNCALVEITTNMPREQRHLWPRSILDEGPYCLPPEWMGALLKAPQQLVAQAASEGADALGIRCLRKRNKH